MAAARRDRRCVVSVDTDFGELLAVGDHAEPSVILLRRAPHRPQDQAELLTTALPCWKTTSTSAPSSSSPPTAPESATSRSDLSIGRSPTEGAVGRAVDSCDPRP
jgi:hypothetical protein